MQVVTIHRVHIYGTKFCAFSVIHFAMQRVCKALMSLINKKLIIEI